LSKQHWYDGLPCYYCGRPAESQDHIIPRRNYKNKRGPNNLKPFKDLLPACIWCNTRRGHSGIEKFRNKLTKWVTNGRKLAQDDAARLITERGFKFYGEQPNAYPCTSTQTPQTG
jgi:hypothetical protein